MLRIDELLEAVTEAGSSDEHEDEADELGRVVNDHGIILSRSRRTLHNSVNDFSAFGSSPPGLAVAAADVELMNNFTWVDLEDEERTTTETVDGDRVTRSPGLMVFFMSSSP